MTGAAQTPERAISAFASRETWQQTASGRAWPLLDPQPHHVHWPDIAEHLGKQARFNGGTAGAFYSVAQHCVLVSRAVLPEYRLPALLHDAHEAYIGDMIQPVKMALARIDPGAAQAFRLLADRTDRAIFAAAGIEYATPEDEAEARAAIKRADLAALATERRDLMADAPAEFEWIALPAPLAVARLRPWSWAEAADIWLDELRRFLPADAGDGI